MADITYEKIKDLSAARSIPILTLDQRWYQLVPEVSKTDEIKFWEGRVNDLLKRQGQITNAENNKSSACTAIFQGSY